MPKVRKAVITAAGRGTRQYPASSAVQKEMFPLVDRDGLTKPVIQIIGEECIESGIEEGQTIGTSFDSMLGKLIVHAPTREQAVARMRFAALVDEFEHGLRAPARRGSPPRSRDARVHQRVVRARQESVVDERVLLDGQRRVQPFEIASAITGNTVA